LHYRDSDEALVATLRGLGRHPDLTLVIAHLGAPEYAEFLWLAHQVAALERLALGDDWLRGVLWHNAARIFA
jgi:hypothetical protein